MSGRQLKQVYLKRSIVGVKYELSKRDDLGGAVPAVGAVDENGPVS